MEIEYVPLNKTRYLLGQYCSCILYLCYMRQPLNALVDSGYLGQGENSNKETRCAGAPTCEIIGNFEMFSSLKGQSRGHFTMFSLLEGHWRGHIITFCLLEGHCRRHFTMFRVRGYVWVGILSSSSCSSSFPFSLPFGGPKH